MTPHADLMLHSQMPCSILIQYETIISPADIDWLQSFAYKRWISILNSVERSSTRIKTPFDGLLLRQYKASCNGCLDAKCNRASEFHLFHKLGRHYVVLPNTSWCTEVRWPSFSWHIYYVLVENATDAKSWRYRGPYATLAGPFRETGLELVLWRGLTVAALE